jgi:hypothetical protein
MVAAVAVVVARVPVAQAARAVVVLAVQRVLAQPGLLARVAAGAGKVTRRLMVDQAVRD